MNQTTPTISAEAEALQANASAIGAAAASIAGIEHTIADYTGMVEKMRAAHPDTSALEQEREDLLASIAIGEKRQADLDALDARLAELRKKRHEAQPGIAGVLQTIAGLQRRLHDEQAKMARPLQERPALVRRFLLSEAEAEGARYGALGVELVQRYKRLLALNSMLSDLGHVPSVLIHGAPLSVPAFRLASHAAFAHHVPGRDGVIYEPNGHTQQERADAIRQEKARLNAMGVEI